MRRVRVHKKYRGKRLSRYERITWTFKAADKMRKMSVEDCNKQFDTHFTVLLDMLNPVQLCEILRIWLLLRPIDFNPVQSTTFQELHDRCHKIIRQDSEAFANESPFFLHAKNKMEMIVRSHIVQTDAEKLIREYLKNETGYSPMSEAEHVELKKVIQQHLDEIKFNPIVKDTTFTVEAWRLKRTDQILYRLYGTDSPE